MYVKRGFIGIIRRICEGAICGNKGGAHTLCAVDIAVYGSHARGLGLRRGVQLVRHFLYTVLYVLHFVGKIGFHFGHGLGKCLFALLHFCKLFIKGGYILLAAFHDGRENLGGLLGAVGQLTDQALVDAELHSLLNVGGVGFHIGDLPLEGPDQVVNGSFRRSVQLVKKAELSVYALHSGVIAFLIGRLEAFHF